MKKLISSFLIVGFLSIACLATETAAPAVTPEVQKPDCCLKAEKEGKTCQNKCCIKAAKEGKVCEKCLKHSHHKKEHKTQDQPAPKADEKQQ